MQYELQILVLFALYPQFWMSSIRISVVSDFWRIFIACSLVQHFIHVMVQKCQEMSMTVIDLSSIKGQMVYEQLQVHHFNSLKPNEAILVK